jgi:hypothetical protein
MRLLTMLFCLSAVSSTAISQEWLPPKNPNPSKIFYEAEADFKTGRHEQALEKYIWFYNHGLEHNPNINSMRIMALSSWRRLGEVYPPAAERLIKERDSTRQLILEDEKLSFSENVFSDLVTLNVVLVQNDDTANVFRHIEKLQPEVAKKLFPKARFGLVLAKEYKLCNSYLEPEETVAADIARFNLIHDPNLDPRFSETFILTHKAKLLNNAATLVALLVQNDRKDEAEKAVERYNSVKTDDEFHRRLAAALNTALTCKFPK